MKHKMNRRSPPPRALFGALCACILLATCCPAAEPVGKWERTVLEFETRDYRGNPFEVPVEARFTHAATGTQLTQLAYYAGNDTWMIGFMPTLTGTWSYEVVSSNKDLDGRTGVIESIESGRPGLLQADPEHPRKWKFVDGPYVIPIALRLEFFLEDSGRSDWDEAVDFLVEEVGGNIYDTRLQDEFSSTMDIFEGNPKQLRFDLEKWERMEARMDALAERNAGAYIMFYADDTGEPQWKGKSYTEALIIRYAVARLSGYPIVLWDTGIDIAEYRSQSDIDWFGKQIIKFDPYDHPVSSRIGGGSGSFAMAGRTYDSLGDRRAILTDMTRYFSQAKRPVAMADSWGENYASRPKKSFSPADIRRAAWKAVIAGGLAIFIRGDDGYFHIDSVQADLESAGWLSLVNPFIKDALGTAFGAMVPDRSLVANGYCLADPGRNRLLYYALGPNDRWDRDSGTDLVLRLADVSGEFTARWFDPRTGADTPAGNLSGGAEYTLTPPTRDDWILLLSRSQSEPTATTRPIR